MPGVPASRAGTTPPSSWDLARPARRARLLQGGAHRRRAPGRRPSARRQPSEHAHRPGGHPDHHGTAHPFPRQVHAFRVAPAEPADPPLGGGPALPEDGPRVNTSRNVEMFAAAPAAGEAICLFLEGTSHARGRLERLRTGAARMVPNSCAAGHAATIVPVGSTSMPWSGSGPEAGAVRALTDCIEQRLKHLLVEAEPRHDLAIVERIDRLYAAARGASRATRGNRSGRRLSPREWRSCGSRMKLPQFRGHLSSWRGGGVHDAENETAVPGGIPRADGRASSIRT